jgi:hypothetical protein
MNNGNGTAVDLVVFVDRPNLDFDDLSLTASTAL